MICYTGHSNEKLTHPVSQNRACNRKFRRTLFEIGAFGFEKLNADLAIQDKTENSACLRLLRKATEKYINGNKLERLNLKVQLATVTSSRIINNSPVANIIPSYTGERIEIVLSYYRNDKYAKATVKISNANHPYRKEKRCCNI